MKNNSTSMMLAEFKKIGLEMKDNGKRVLEIFGMLPPEIKQATIPNDSLGNMPLYNFGNPLEISNTYVYCSGGIQNHEIKHLYLALRTALQHLTPSEIQNYIKNINNIDKHEDYIFEMRPILNLRVGLKAQYESQNNCNEGRNIDWEIKNGEYIILVEVKNRIKSTIAHLKYCLELSKKLKAGIAPENISLPSAPDPVDLFKNILEKYKDQTDSRTLQGAWISSIIKEDENKLNEYFEKIDSKKIQFAIFSGWDNGAYILVKDEKYRPILLDYFSLIELKDFVLTY